MPSPLAYNGPHRKSLALHNHLEKSAETHIDRTSGERGARPKRLPAVHRAGRGVLGTNRLRTLTKDHRLTAVHRIGTD